MDARGLNHGTRHARHPPGGRRMRADECVVCWARLSEPVKNLRDRLCGRCEITVRSAVARNLERNGMGAKPKKKEAR